MSKPSGTDGSLLASLPWTLAALAFSVLPHIQFLPIWVTVIFLSCSLWRWLVERNRWRLPPAWLRIVVALICFIGVLASYESVSGVGPGSALLAVMAALKLMETKRRRDQFVLLFISIFLIMSSLLREQYLWSLPYLFAGVAMTMTAWLRMSIGTHNSARQSFATATRLLAYAAPLTIAMWILFPRIATPFWSVPIDTGSGTSGLSEFMSPGDISSLSLSDAVAFRVNFAGEVPPPEDRYWRGLVLGDFNGRTWSGNEPSVGARTRERIDYRGVPVNYQVTMEPTRQHWIYALDVPYEWDINRTDMARQQQLIRRIPVDQRITYNAVSHTDYRINVELSDWAMDNYTKLPENRNPETVALAKEMRESAGTNEVFINRVLRKFNAEEFYYTLQPPALGSNPVDRFLFDTQQGFCEHYASAFAVMMRAAGIPSRIVLGYQGGEVNPLNGRMIVRQSDAHAWTEVWLRGRGWYRVDPTAAVAPERIDLGMSGAMIDGIGASWGLSAPSQLLYQLQFTWDALNAGWNEWILAYGPENQSRFMESLGMEYPGWRKLVLTLVIVTVIILAFESYLLMRRYLPPRKDEAAVLYRKFTKTAGIEPQVGESPLAYAVRIAQDKTDLAGDADNITSSYLAARYGPPDATTMYRLKTSVEQFASRY